MCLRNSTAKALEPDFLKELVDDQEFDDLLSRHLVLAGLLDPDKVFPLGIPPHRADACGLSPRARKARPLSKPGRQSRHP
jgi:hypothetical protein